MKKVKYLLLPGMVRSNYDGDLHFINERDLIKLYMVDPEECVWPTPGRSAEYLRRRYPYLEALSPIVNGYYPLFKEMDKEKLAPKIRKIWGE